MELVFVWRWFKMVSRGVGMIIVEFIEFKQNKWILWQSVWFKADFSQQTILEREIIQDQGRKDFTLSFSLQMKNKNNQPKQERESSAFSKSLLINSRIIV